ncbi:MAG: biotin/lipoyl-binding protein, partial [Pseudomonadales bacterium]|nr:biotin/lipoyl-binding protein [Pseudomonadales bacterium]
MLHTVRTPDLGTDEAEVIEILVKVGQIIEIDTPLVSLESAKASMEVPSPLAGTVEAILVKLGDKIAEGTVLVQLTDSSQQLAVNSEQLTDNSQQLAVGNEQSTDNKEQLADNSQQTIVIDEAVS